MPTTLEQIVQSVKDAAKDKNEKKSVGELVQFVVFELDREEYALLITDVQEIIELPEITPVPNAPDFVKGIINLRGKIVVIIDLEKKFNLKREKETPAKHIIIAEFEGMAFGIMVDFVKEVVRVPLAAVQETPALVSSKIHADYLRGVVPLARTGESLAGTEAQSGVAKEGSRLLILLDLPKMMQSQEIAALGSKINEVTK